MTKNIKLPKYSDTAHVAAILTESPMAVVITSNPKTESWEARVWGKNEAFAYLAGLMADAALPAINNMKFPPEVERVIDLLNSKPAGKN